MPTYTLPQASGFERDIDGMRVGLFAIHTPDRSCSCAITNYGCRLVSLLVPDAHQRPTDIVLGFPNLEAYLEPPEQYMGAIIGRCANRIAAGLFVLGGKTHILPVNDGPNTLHSGPGGFHARVWQVLKHSDHMLVLTYRSADGEGGFPGTVEAELVYEWTDNATLQMRYHAITDKATLVNLSNHSYFNLHGEGADSVLDHELEIAASACTPVNATQIPLGDIMNVEQTPFDFRTATTIGDCISEDDRQLKIGKGYDMNFVLDGMQPAVQLRSPRSGIRLSLSTDRPGLQLYSGNHLDGRKEGKTGHRYGFRSAVALEPQGFPDAIHHPQFPSVVLNPGEVFYSVSSYRFSTD